MNRLGRLPGWLVLACAALAAPLVSFAADTPQPAPAAAPAARVPARPAAPADEPYAPAAAPAERPLRAIPAAPAAQPAPAAAPDARAARARAAAEGYLLPRARIAPAAPAMIAPAQRAVRPRPDAVADERTMFEELTDLLEGFNDPNVRNMEAQFRPQFQQLLYSELAFLRRTCGIDPKQFKPLAKESGGRLRFMVREYAVAIGSRRGGAYSSVPEMTDPRTRVQRLLADVIQSKLSPEQAQRYREESDRRTASRRRTIVLNLVAALDERLVLSVDQREKLVQSLLANYQDAWDQWLQMLCYNPQTFPAIPDSAIVPLLNEKQQSVWRQTPKQPANVFWGVQFNPGGMGVAGELQEIATIVEEAQDDH